ncbi:MAG: hypothetical protein K9M99_05195 [Candidatus Cloacimonetes bacterium]|nr:hypothetical protein [Candidatus Cloacimonadota bacterium]
MGSGYKARCLDCGKEFMVSEGPGFHTVILHCDKCGKETGIGHDEDDVLYFEYVHAIIGLPHDVNDNIEECAPEIQKVIRKCR